MSLAALILQVGLFLLWTHMTHPDNFLHIVVVQC